MKMASKLKGTKYVTPDGKLYFFDKNSGNAYTNRWRLKSMVSGMNSTIKAMHKLRRVNSTQQMAQHGSTVMQLVKCDRCSYFGWSRNTTSVQMVPQVKGEFVTEMARLATTL